MSEALEYSARVIPKCNRKIRFSFRKQYPLENMSISLGSREVAWRTSEKSWYRVTRFPESVFQGRNGISACASGTKSLPERVPLSPMHLLVSTRQKSQTQSSAMILETKEKPPAWRREHNNRESRYGHGLSGNRGWATRSKGRSTRVCLLSRCIGVLRGLTTSEPEARTTSDPQLAGVLAENRNRVRGDFVF